METREVSSAPGMLGLYAKAAGALVPGLSHVPFVGAKRGADVPDVELVMRDVEVDRDHLAAYDRVCGFALRDTLPATYLHVLAFPLQMAIVTDGSFPFPAVGLVHISNRITQQRPVRIGEPLSFSVKATPVEPHPKGRQFALVTEARVGDEPVFKGVSRTLRRGESNGERKGGEKQGKADPAELETTAEWSLPGHLGRQYGAVSGDRNPIHMHDLTAKLLGFPRAIAHGMWTKARCLAALESQLPEAYTVEVQFRKPILLPAKVAFSQSRTQGGISFAVRDARKGTPHLEGAVVGE